MELSGAGDPLIAGDAFGKGFELVCNLFQVRGVPLRDLSERHNAHVVECPFECRSDAANFCEVVFLRRGRQCGLGDLQCQLIAGRLDRAWSDAAVSANLERGPDFDESHLEATDFFFLFVDYVRPARELSLNGLDGADALLQGGDVLILYFQSLLVSEPLCLKFVDVSTGVL